MGVLINYIAYAIINAIDSPNTSQEKTNEVSTMPVPDVRVCARFEKELQANETFINAFTIVCNFADGRDYSPYFNYIDNPDYIPVLDDGSRTQECVAFLPPLDIYFHNDPDTNTSVGNNQLELRLLKNNIPEHVIMFYATYYPSQNSQYRVLFGMNGGDSKISTQDAQDQLIIEKDSTILKNTFDFELDHFATTTYSVTEAQTLKNSSWNYFGFANIYDKNYNT